MKDWHAFSSTDLVTWTDHGVIFSLDDITWATKAAFAPDCMRRNGKYYFYFPTENQIGVAVSDSPAGPFRDALGKPLIAAREHDIITFDPAIYLDDDGQAYLYYGGGSKLGVVKLEEDMITRAGPIKRLSVRNYNGKYYLSYASRAGDKIANLLEYSVGDSPLGPFEYKGVILDNRSRNVHHSIVEFGAQWYLFYHVQGPSPFERRVHAEYLYYDDRGNILPIEMTDQGIALR